MAQLAGPAAVITVECSIDNMWVLEVGIALLAPEAIGVIEFAFIGLECPQRARDAGLARRTHFLIETFAAKFSSSVVKELRYFAATAGTFYHYNNWWLCF